MVQQRVRDTKEYLSIWVRVSPDRHAAAEDINAAIADGALPVGEAAGLPLHRFDLADTAAAHAAVEESIVGKVLIDVAVG